MPLHFYSKIVLAACGKPWRPSMFWSPNVCKISAVPKISAVQQPVTCLFIVPYAGVASRMQRRENKGHAVGGAVFLIKISLTVKRYNINTTDS
jgi:hypothetical protein